MTQTEQKDAVSFLKDQHRDVRDLFTAIAEANGDERRDQFETLVRLLAVHETAEEMVIYPTIRAEGERGERVAEARLSEEDEAKKMLADLEKLDPSASEFDELLKRFRTAVETHAEREEQEAFPLLESVADDDRLGRMTSALKVVEGLAPTHPHKTAPEGALGNMLVGPFVAMVDRVRDAIRDATR
jgi:hemerythrin superfamily protein